jgi:transcriptional regulator with XRE-family HTH domain
MNKMRELRKKKKLTMKELGKAVGVSESTISLYENGKHEPDLVTIKRIADILETSLDELTGRYEPDEQLNDNEAWAFRERYRRDPSYRLLFDAANKATPESLKAAAAVLMALEPKEDD